MTNWQWERHSIQYVPGSLQSQHEAVSHGVTQMNDACTDGWIDDAGRFNLKHRD